MNGALRNYQQNRLSDVREWYRKFYLYRASHEEDPVDPVVIRYLILWAVFNALYNIPDMPNRRVSSVEGTGKDIRPRI